MKTTPSHSSFWLYLSLAAISAVSVLSVRDIILSTNFGGIDFMGYWSATHLISQGENPYSLELMTAVQRLEAHSTLGVTLMSWNPPTLFIFLLPLGLMPFVTAKVVWVFINMTLVLSAGWMLTNIYMQAASARVRFAFLIFVIGFPAVLTGIYMGQVTFLVFWGMVACVALMKNNRWFWAGAVLVLATIKPHITVLSVIYILVYMARNRQWRGWLGLALAGITCMVILLLLRPGLIADLQGSTVVAGVPWATSTLGGLISYLGFSDAARYLIILFLPLPFLLAKHSDTFSLELSIALLTLITVPTTFFGWSYDQAILLIPIAQVFAWMSRSGYRWPVIASIVCAMLLNYYQRLVVINETYYVWIPLFWWVIFVVEWRTSLSTDQNNASSKLRAFLNYRFR
ncbi:MAG TPA: glycosyltransferase family 87 protein [Anaerolineales bacterium]